VIPFGNRCLKYNSPNERIARFTARNGAVQAPISKGFMRLSGLVDDTSNSAGKTRDTRFTTTIESAKINTK
jgi:hypothetical protein